MNIPNINIETFLDLLKKEKIIPVQENWNLFVIEHPGSKPDNNSEREQIAKIKKEVGTKAGLYCYYNNNNRCLYVGKAKPLFNRIKSHYKESFTENAGRGHQWNSFFGNNTGMLNLYWIEIEDEDLRVIIERLIAFLEKPQFEEVTPRIR